MTRQDAIRRATAALRLSQRAGTPGEAAAAAAAAQAIMDKYEIEREALKLDGAATEEPDEDPIDFGLREGASLDPKSELWKRHLAQYIARSNGCFIYRSGSYENKPATIEVVGEPSAVDTVRYLYAYLVGEIRRLAREKGRGMGEPWRREFREGAVSELGEILRIQRRNTVAAIRREAEEADRKSGSSTALVRVQQAIAKTDARVDVAVRLAKSQGSWRTLKSSGRGEYHPTARDEGARAARSIQLGGSTPRIGGRRRELGGGS